MKIFVIVIIILLVFSVLLPFFSMTDLTDFLYNAFNRIALGFEFLVGIFKGFTSAFDPYATGNDSYSLILGVVMVFVALWVIELIFSHIIGGKE